MFARNIRRTAGRKVEQRVPEHRVQLARGVVHGLGREAVGYAELAGGGAQGASHAARILDSGALAIRTVHYSIDGLCDAAGPCDILVMRAKISPPRTIRAWEPIISGR